MCLHLSLWSVPLPVPEPVPGPVLVLVLVLVLVIVFVLDECLRLCNLLMREQPIASAGNLSSCHDVENQAAGAF